MVEVFKTNVSDEETAAFILTDLLDLMPSSRINFDLEDCDKILRVESSINSPDVVIPHLQKLGYDCEVLE